MATLTTLVSFNHNDKNGNNYSNPAGGLLIDAAGNLFGTVVQGSAGGGAVFELTNSGTLSTLVNFNVVNGQAPYATLIADTVGDLFGTTQTGGGNFAGTAFKIAKTPSGYGGLTTLVSFDTSANNVYAGLVADAGGNLFGTTYSSSPGMGTVFELANTGSRITPTYASTAKTLVTFTGANGANPEARLLIDAAGNLFGTTTGDSTHSGTAFEIVKTAGVYAGAPTVLGSFAGNSVGAVITAGLVADTAGDLFGTTYSGGANGLGSVFEIAKNPGGGYAALTTLASFASNTGENPKGSLLIDAVGNLFGTTDLGGAGYGTVFEIAKSAGV